MGNFKPNKFENKSADFPKKFPMNIGRYIPVVFLLKRNPEVQRISLKVSFRTCFEIYIKTVLGIIQNVKKFKARKNFNLEQPYGCEDLKFSITKKFFHCLDYYF